MPIPEPILDDLRFQRDLVDEARRRIIRYCPEWTDYNLSDPGITLIELFAWMTEMIVYRLNQVPEKNYLKFLDLLGLDLQPASSARTELTFRLSIPFPVTPEDDTTAVVPAGTEVATRLTDQEREVIFTTDSRLVVYPPRLAHVRRDQDFHKNYLPRLGVETFHPFQAVPKRGDTFFLGFDETQDIRGHILRLEFQCEETQATGVRRNDPPWIWECSTGNGQWEPVRPSTLPNERDTTGGLNNAEGLLTLYLPLTMKADAVNGRTAFWVRCRVEQTRKEQGMYTQSPRVLSVKAYTLGATTPATHAVQVRGTLLGQSTGEPGQTFRLPHSPILKLQPGETVEVQEKRDGELVFAPWQYVSDFSDSDRYDRHFTVDTSTGEVQFGPVIRQPGDALRHDDRQHFTVDISTGEVRSGPAIRQPGQPDSIMRHYGRVPEAGRWIRFTQYRYGGGVAGNVPAGKLQVLKSAIAYIDRVTNLKAASGGRDAEDLDEAKMRARREIRTQQRAVTAEDHEHFARSASRSVARVKCLTPGQDSAVPPGVAELLVVPAAFDALKTGDLSKLYLDPALAQTIQAHLDPYRLLTTSVRIREPRYVGIKVAAEIVPNNDRQPEEVAAHVIESLRHFLTPLSLAAGRESEALLGPDWEGWPFGQSLFVSEIYSLIQKVPGVKHVLSAQLSQRPVVPRQETLLQEQESEEGQPTAAVGLALTPVTDRRLDLAPDMLLCSLNHEIKIVEL